MSEIRRQIDLLRVHLNEFPLIASVVDVPQSRREKIEQLITCEKWVDSKLLLLKSIKLFGERQEGEELKEDTEDELEHMITKVNLWKSILDMAVYNDKIFTLFKNEEISDKDEEWKGKILKLMSGIKEKHEKFHYMLEKLSEAVDEIHEKKKASFEELCECKKRVTSEEESSNVDENKEYNRLKSQVERKIVKINFMRMFMLKVLIHSGALKSVRLFDLQRKLRHPVTFENIDKRPAAEK